MNVTIIVPSLNPDEKMVNTVKGILAEGFTETEAQRSIKNLLRRWRPWRA